MNQGNNGHGQGRPLAGSLTEQQAEKARCKGILLSAEAQGRSELAKHLAFNTSSSVEEARKILAVSPLLNDGSAASRAARFSEAMSTGEEIYARRQASAGQLAAITGTPGEKPTIQSIAVDVYARRNADREGE